MQRYKQYAKDSNSGLHHCFGISDYKSFLNDRKQDSPETFSAENLPGHVQLLSVALCMHGRWGEKICKR